MNVYRSACLFICLSLAGCDAASDDVDRKAYEAMQKRLAKALCAPTVEERASAIAALLRYAPKRKNEQAAQIVEDESGNVTKGDCPASK